MAATQAERPFRLKTPLGDDALLVDSFQGVERVSTPFRFVLKVLSLDPNIDMKGQMNQPAVLSIVLSDGSERHIHGNINRMKLLEYGEDGYAAYELEMVAWLWFMNLFSDCRIFQNKTVPDIVEQLFKDRGFSDYKLQLQGSYTARDYCVQYRETDFNFVSRLLEEEGIFYFFEQSEDKHILVLADQTSAFEPCPHLDKSTARFLGAAGGVQDNDTVTALESEFKVQTGNASLSDYDFEKPNTSLFATLGSEWKGEYYDYPGRYTTKADGDKYARIRLEEQEVQLSTLRGSSNCMGFECGYKFTLSDHARDKANGDYTLLGLEHHGRNASYRAGKPDPFEYGNRFEAIPNAVTFRPPRRARKPIIPSTQTAVVVGKSGEEIWTDKYGRVKVQFYWDRQGKMDENSSCWIRVSQGWAGKQWGSIYIPRIGHEVVVSFLEGDPDRPLITGRVYNADQTVPYALPDEQTKSTLKSLSSKGGDGFNELRFEDKKGSEEIFIHGEKDLEIQIKHDRHENIGNDRHLIVGQDKFEQVGRDSNVTIGRDQVETISRDNHYTVNGKYAGQVGQGASLSIGQDYNLQVGSGLQVSAGSGVHLIAGSTFVIEASAGITLKCGGNFITLNSAGVQVTGTMIMLNSGGAALSGPGVTTVTPQGAAAAKKAADDKAGSSSVPSATPGEIMTISLAALSASSAAAAKSAGGPTHNPNSEENKDKKHYIEIVLVDGDGKPVPGEMYKVTAPDGSVDTGSLNEKGYAKITGLDAGSCKVSFPRLDKDYWSEK